MPDGPTVVPVVLQPHGDASQPAQCGVYLDTAYTPLINQKFTYTDMCQSIAGVASVGDGPHPRLLFLFNVNSGHGPDNRLPAVLTWNGHAYQFDEPATGWLTQQRGATSLASARALLRSHR